MLIFFTTTYLYILYLIYMKTLFLWLFFYLFINYIFIFQFLICNIICFFINYYLYFNLLYVTLYGTWDQKDEMIRKSVYANIEGEWKTRQEFSTITLWNNWRDVAQLGSAFVLGTKCHRFESCHPYLLLLKGAVTGD